MRTAIKLILVYLGIQIVGMLLALLPCLAYVLTHGGDIESAQSMALAPSLLIAVLLMVLYLWKFGYLPQRPESWRFPKWTYLAWAFLAMCSLLWLLDVFMTYVHLPDIMKAGFDVIQSGWIGIFCLAVAGPVLEELLFRGAVTRALLKQYPATKAVVLSGLLFGIFHVNPAQVAGAVVIGLLFAWMYCQTGSLWPSVILHVLNNSSAIWLNWRFPDAETVCGLLSAEMQGIITAVALLILILSVWRMNKAVVAVDWR